MVRVALAEGKTWCLTEHTSSKSSIWSQTPKESSHRATKSYDLGFHQTLILLNNLNLAGSFPSEAFSYQTVQKFVQCSKFLADRRKLIKESLMQIIDLLRYKEKIKDRRKKCFVEIMHQVQTITCYK